MKKIYVLGFDQMILPLTKTLAERGFLPNLKRLMEEGSANQVIPSFPAWTPTNWATLATGAETGTHSVFGWYVDTEKGEPIPAFHSSALTAETIWEVAERAGVECAIIHYPASMPSRLRNGYVVDGFAAPRYGGSPFEITPSKCYTTLDIPVAERIQPVPAEGWKSLPSSKIPPLEFEVRIIPKYKGRDLVLYALVVASQGEGYDRVLICRRREGEAGLVDLGEGEWSPWIREYFSVGGREVEGSMRFKLIELSKDGGRIRLYRSQVFPIQGFTHPEGLGKELIDRFGPYQEHVSEFSYLSGATDFETCLEEAEYQAKWFVKAAKYLVEEKGCSLFYSHWHFLDDINHHHLAQIDPSWPHYDPGEAEGHWGYITRAYQVIDGMVGEIAESMDEETYLVIVSDHGNLPIHRLLSMERFLLERGFLAVKDPSLPLSIYHPGWWENIDWDRTQVYMKRGVYLLDFSFYINAEGEEYNRIQGELIRELRTWVDEETGKTPIAMALRKRDAPLLGCWGDQIGDVVVVLEDGYYVAKSSLPTNIAPATGIVTAGHSRQLPTAQTGLSSHLATFIIRGPDIKRGYERPVERLGYIHMRDIVPTLCYILGIEPPTQSQGVVARDLFEGYEGVRERLPYKREEKKRDLRVWTQRDMFDFTLIEQSSKKRN